MFVVGGIGIVLMDLALDRNRAKSVKVSYATAGISSVVLAYVMSMLFIRIKIPGAELEFQFPLRTPIMV
ncbi:hypothetical protein DVH24_018824 [Malus domestica]|uniref:Uncharacterized protein n=1 Tax=Malus domestica TaxID=3750 RepID=A0A498HKM2_MALDO|nr:hypothetical protein DVH24_018824 [Malus domestica]